MDNMLTAEEVMSAAMEYVVKLPSDWPAKVLLLLPVTLYDYLGGDGHILIAFYVAFLADLVTGVCSALKRRAFAVKRLHYWVIKLIVYSLCIYLVGLVDLAFTYALRGFHLPLMDIIVAILLANEVVSVFHNLHEMTAMVPPTLMRAAEKLQRKAEARLDSSLGDNTEGKNNG